MAAEPWGERLDVSVLRSVRQGRLPPDTAERTQRDSALPARRRVLGADHRLGVLVDTPDRAAARTSEYHPSTITALAGGAGQRADVERSRAPGHRASTSTTESHVRTPAQARDSEAVDCQPLRSIGGRVAQGRQVSPTYPATRYRRAERALDSGRVHVVVGHPAAVGQPVPHVGGGPAQPRTPAPPRPGRRS